MKNTTIIEKQNIIDKVTPTIPSSLLRILACDDSSLLLLALSPPALLLLAAVVSIISVPLVRGATVGEGVPGEGGRVGGREVEGCLDTGEGWSVGGGEEEAKEG